jgi:hypothetical protein
MGRRKDETTCSIIVREREREELRTTGAFQKVAAETMVVVVYVVRVLHQCAGARENQRPGFFFVCMKNWGGRERERAQLAGCVRTGSATNIYERSDCCYLSCELAWWNMQSSFKGATPQRVWFFDRKKIYNTDPGKKAYLIRYHYKQQLMKS